MFKTDKIVFKRLAKLPIRKRLDVAKSPGGGSILGSLSPSQFAELFPRYYQQGLPDVGGFRAATTAAARERQSEASASLLDRLTKAEKGVEEYATQTYEKIKRKLGLTKAAAQLTPEQQAAFDSIMKGPIGAQSDQGKIFSKLTDQQLSSIGVSRSKDNTGRDVFQYAPPEVSREEAESRLKTGAAAGSANQKALDLIRKREGFVPDAKWDRNHYRLGYGSDTITKADGTVIEVKPGMTVTKEDAERDLLRRMPQFQQNGVIKFVGQDAWNKLNPSTKAALTSLAYNYGSIDNLDSLKKAIISGDKNAIANAIDSYQTHNNGINAGRRAEEANMVRSSADTTESVAPVGSNGKYTDDQINKMMDQLREEKNTTRKQQLANLLTDAGVSTATINSISEVQTSGATAEHYGESKQCVALSKHFAPQIGPASSWQFHEGIDGIVPGAVIATTRYSDGSGGKMARNMPDGKSHYHTGVALTRPDASGNVLILDQAAGHGSRITKVNIHDYNGEKWRPVRGGEPTEHSMQAVNIALNRANDSERGAIMQSMQGKEPRGTSSAEIKPVAESVPPPPPAAKPVNQEGQPADIPRQMPGAPKEAVQQTATVKPPQEDKPPPPKPTGTKFHFDKEAYLNEVGNKQPMAYSFVGPGREGVWKETVQGFRDAEAAGVVKFNEKTGEVTVNDMNHSKVQEILGDMKKYNLDRNVFMKQIEEKKQQTKPAPIPETKPKDQVSKVEPPAQPQSPEPQQTAQATPTPEVPKVPGASDGGSFNVPGDVNFYPMDKRDNMAAVDTKTQKPLFTAKGGERIDVTPQQKVSGDMKSNAPDLRSEMDAIRQEMQSAFTNAGKAPDIQMRQLNTPKSDTGNYIDSLVQQNKTKQYHNPAFERAMVRTRMSESGDPLNNHFSAGNTNG